MWKKIYEIIKDLFLLQRETQQNKEDIKELRNEVKQIRDEMQKLILIVQKLSFDIQEVSKREESARRELTLQLENEMLRFERRLPQGKDFEK